MNRQAEPATRYDAAHHELLWNVCVSALAAALFAAPVTVIAIAVVPHVQLWLSGPGPSPIGFLLVHLPA